MFKNTIWLQSVLLRPQGLRSGGQVSHYLPPATPLLDPPLSLIRLHKAAIV